jgi:nitrate/nitrite-specific signal transduction histidine kinase
MRDRALLLNGHITIQNLPDKGTLVRVAIPIGEKDESIPSFVGG